MVVLIKDGARRVLYGCLILNKPLANYQASNQQYFRSAATYVKNQRGVVLVAGLIKAGRGGDEVAVVRCICELRCQFETD